MSAFDSADPMGSAELLFLAKIQTKLGGVISMRETPQESGHEDPQALIKTFQAQWQWPYP
jgi:hypothetical protein